MPQKRQAAISDFFAPNKGQKTAAAASRGPLKGAPLGAPKGGPRAGPLGAPKGAPQGAPEVTEVLSDSSEGENHNPTKLQPTAGAEKAAKQQQQQQQQQQKQKQLGPKAAQEQQEKQHSQPQATAADEGTVESKATAAAAAAAGLPNAAADAAATASAASDTAAAETASVAEAAAASPSAASEPAATAAATAEAAAKTSSAAAAAAAAAAAGAAASAVSPFGTFVSTAAAENMWREALGDSWYEALQGELQKPYFRKCLLAVKEQREKFPSSIYPPQELMFKAFRSTPLDKVKVVIVGQDPYHQPGQAMAMPRGVRPPPSLTNIFKEIDRSIPGSPSLPLAHGDLSSWAAQGVLLLNAILTVKRDSPMSHKDLGWERFTDEVLAVVNKTLEGVVFLLWGKAAEKKSSGVSPLRHKLLKAAHPSPLAVRLFAGCGHFAKCNELLQQMGKQPIDFRLQP
ncbi:uracil-DNA glycosylase, putative [Eimeria necatrix]|uniref:Uracil-DNA glycosylase n=1 Tax=Eimeria necatrix TaxID=51315 RepID=U6MG28_9EIME|nr:uracil-DNA glycosylase, putative [Eimeria necatrix]CDJ63192.1 uracil-DNA glycosylase, putative [Eimeria necatrix]